MLIYPVACSREAASGPKICLRCIERKALFQDDVPGRAGVTGCDLMAIHVSGGGAANEAAPPASRLMTVAAVRTAPVAVRQSPARPEVRRPDLAALLASQTQGVGVYDFDQELVQVVFREVIWMALTKHGASARHRFTCGADASRAAPTPCHNPACPRALGRRVHHHPTENPFGKFVNFSGVWKSGWMSDARWAVSLTKVCDETQRHARHGPSMQPAWLTGELFAQRIQPLLANISSAAIRSQIGVSRWYAGRIREGYRPHPRIRGTGQR